MVSWFRFVISALLSLTLAAPPLQAQVRLPSLGESAAEDFNVGVERRLGEQIMGSVWRDPDYLDEPVLQEYLQSLWLPLVQAARASGNIEADVATAFAWDVFLVRDKSINAFALPGGWVGVHLGLIAMTQTRDELASVLAHELSHVSQRHIARSVVNSQRQSLVGLAGMILALLAASRSNNTDAVQAAVAGGQAVALQGQLNFSRDMEREADRIGFATLVAAGFAPAGMSAMFDRLDSANRLNDSGAFAYLRSHPLTVDRLAEARSKLLLAPVVAPAPPLLHAMMQARARVLMDSDPQTLRRLQEPLAGQGATPVKRDRMTQLYAGTMASLQLRDTASAQRGLDEMRSLLAAATPAEPLAERQAALLQTQLQLALGRPADAWQTLARVDPEGRSRAAMLLRAQAALDLRRLQPAAAAEPLRQSTEALQTWLAEHKRDGAAWNLLAAVADASGLRLRALRANAEARAAEGDLGGAIDRFRAAQQAARGASVGQDFIEASIIDARLRDLMAQRRQLALEMSGRRAPRPDGDTPPQ